MVRTGLIALTLMVAAPLGAQAQTIDLGRGGPQIDLRSKAQRQRDYQREDYRREMYRRDRDRDLTTGSVRRYRDYGDDRRYDRRDRW